MHVSDDGISPHLSFLFWRNLCSDAFLAMGRSEGTAADGSVAAGFSDPDPASCISSLALSAGKSSNTSIRPS